MEYRRLERKDIEKTFILCLKFFAEGWDKTLVRFNKRRILEILYDSVEKGSPDFFIALDKDRVIGIIGVLVVSSFFDDTQIIASELVWYVEQEYRGKGAGKNLLNYMEDYYRKRGDIDLIIVTAGHFTIETGTDRALDILYRRKKYKKLEIHYVKELRRQ